MKKLTLLAALFFWVFTVQAQSSLSILEKAQQPELHLPPYQVLKLSNGLELMLQADRSLPLVRGYLYVRTGTIYEPADRVGVASMMAELLRRGGTKQHPPQDFDRILAERGAEISVAVSDDYGLVSFQCLAEDLAQVLGLVFEMLREPAFDPQRLELVRFNILEALKRQNDQGPKIAAREFPKLIYGKNSIYARTPTPQSISQITVQDLQKFYQKSFTLSGMLLALSGDFSNSAVRRWVGQATEAWPLPAQVWPAPAPLIKTWPKSLNLIAKKTDQATLILGHYGDKRFNPDKYALLLLNDILGGDALTSRLGMEIRSSLGLVYGIYSQFGLENDDGIFSIAAQTENKNTKKVLLNTQKILAQVLKPGAISEQELQEHKSSLLNSLYAQYEPSYNFLKGEARYRYYGYPPYYLKVFSEEIAKVQIKDLERVAKKYFHPETLQILIVGNPASIGPLPGAKQIKLEP